MSTPPSDQQPDQPDRPEQQQPNQPPAWGGSSSPYGQSSGSASSYGSATPYGSAPSPYGSSASSPGTASPSYPSQSGQPSQTGYDPYAGGYGQAPPPHQGWQQQQPGQQAPQQWGQQPPPTGQYGYGGAAPAARQGKNFFAKLFDLSFSSFVTPSIIKIVYIVILALIVLGWLGLSITGFSRSVGRGLLFLIIVGPLVSLLYVIVARISLEFYLAVFRIAEDVREMKDSRKE